MLVIKTGSLLRREHKHKRKYKQKHTKKTCEPRRRKN